MYLWKFFLIFQRIQQQIQLRRALVNSSLNLGYPYEVYLVSQRMNTKSKIRNASALNVLQHIPHV